MSVKGPFDGREIAFGALLTLYTLVVLVLLLWSPFGFQAMVDLAGVVTLGALVVTLYLCNQALRLYGRRSAEGRLWFKIIALMVITAIGLVINEFITDEVHAFSISAIIGFAIVAWGIIERLASAGLRPTVSDIIIAGVIVGFVLLLLFVVMFQLAESGLRGVGMGGMWVEMVVVVLALGTTFLAVLISRLMGGYLSKGWHFVALGAATFSVTYTLVVVFKAMGLYDEFLFIEAFQVMALSSVSFSAYYQRKRHLEMIDGI